MIQVRIYDGGGLLTGFLTFTQGVRDSGGNKSDWAVNYSGCNYHLTVGFGSVCEPDLQVIKDGFEALQEAIEQKEQEAQERDES